MKNASTIGGGNAHKINTGSQYAFIGGGNAHSLTGNASAIVGGDTNTTGGNCSVILGGANNSDGGNDFTAVFGNGLTASAVPGVPSALWVDTLVAPNIPVGSPTTCAPPTGLPLGTLYYVIPTGTTYKQLFIA